jgi:hypothetical protein
LGTYSNSYINYLRSQYSLLIERMFTPNCTCVGARGMLRVAWPGAKQLTS